MTFSKTTLTEKKEMTDLETAAILILDQHFSWFSYHPALNAYFEALSQNPQEVRSLHDFVYENETLKSELSKCNLTVPNKPFCDRENSVFGEISGQGWYHPDFENLPESDIFYIWAHCKSALRLMKCICDYRANGRPAGMDFVIKLTEYHADTHSIEAKYGDA